MPVLEVDSGYGGEHVEAGLGCGVGAGGGKRREGGSGAHVDDAARGLLSHHRDHRLHGEQRRDEVELKQGAEVIGLDLLDGRL